ncbi:MAG: PLDc protein [Patescibacteria group bacterium]|nr:PLDc protein [Patescibacteria group bacterium]
MKKIFSLFFLSFVLLNSNPAFAQKEEVKVLSKENPSITIQFNGMEEFDKEFVELQKEFDGKKIEVNYKDAGSLGGFFAAGVAFIIFILLICLAFFIFWIAMLVHAISKPVKSKAVWILILLIFGIIGAIVYYFAIKRDFEKKDEALSAEKVEESK